MATAKRKGRKEGRKPPSRRAQQQEAGRRSIGFSAWRGRDRASRPSFAPGSRPSSPWPTSCSSTPRSSSAPAWTMARCSSPHALLRRSALLSWGSCQLPDRARAWHGAQRLFRLHHGARAWRQLAALPGTNRICSQPVFDPAELGGTVTQMLAATGSKGYSLFQ